MLSESLLVNKIKYYASLPWLSINQRVYQYQKLLKTEIILDYEIHLEDTHKANFYTRSLKDDNETILFRQQEYHHTYIIQTYNINSTNFAQMKVILSRPVLYASEIILISHSKNKTLLHVYFDCIGIKELKFAKEQLLNYHSLQIRELFLKVEEEHIIKHQSIFNLNDTTDYVAPEKNQKYYKDHYRLQELDLEEADIYHKLHEKLKNHKLNSNTLIRFLCARRFDLDATCELIDNWIKWRKDNHIYRLFAKDYSEFDIFQVIGESKEGRPVIYTRQSKLFPSKINQDRYAQYFIAFLEDTLRSCKGMVDSYVTVLDVEGFGYSNFDMQLTKRLLQMVLQYFPERQNKVFIINISFVVMGIYKTLKQFLPVRTNDKLVFIGKDINEIKRADHPSRPIIILKIVENLVLVSKDRQMNISKYEIVLEKFHSKAVEAQQMLIQIAEPSSITQNIQTFTITFYSLYTAMTLDWDERRIIEALDGFAKNEVIPKDIIDFIHEHTKYFNRASFYLKQDHYYLRIECSLLDEMKRKRQFQSETFLKEEECGEPSQRIFKIQENAHLDVIKELVEDYNVPVQQEYDYHEQAYDVQKKSQYKMKAIYQLYEHQKQALSKIFLKDVGHSGVIILPCGAGKTLLGINVALKIKRRTLIVCDTVNDVLQWQKSFLHFTQLDKNTIAVLMRQEQELGKHILERENIIIITNKDMLQSKRQDIDRVKKLTWALLIMDEVHGLPAEKVGFEFSRLKTHMKIGLTATPYRQDNKIKEIFHKVGPKLHESMIVDLTALGFVSKIYCVQIQVGMEEEYAKRYNQYQERNNQQIMNTLYQMNPKKFQIVQHLIDFHRARKDKILIFLEKINKLWKTGALVDFAKDNNCPIILLDVEQNERQAIYKLFQEDKLDVIIFGQIADQGLDLPSANVGIQISFNFKSVRQEFQRMGRIQRKKENTSGNFDCFFYTLVSRGTKEVEIQFERQIAVINQGYPYEIISDRDVLQNQMLPASLDKILKTMSTKILESISTRDDEQEDDGY